MFLTPTNCGVDEEFLSFPINKVASTRVESKEKDKKNMELILCQTVYVKSKMVSNVER